MVTDSLVYTPITETGSGTLDLKKLQKNYNFHDFSTSEKNFVLSSEDIDSVLSKLKNKKTELIVFDEIV